MLLSGEVATLHAVPRTTSADRYMLSQRELQILALIADGQSNRSIATNLSISERTVENHVTHILNKLGLDSRTAVATFALRHGLIS
jgi:DNA-binding NarL/FixJ family response regulator